jgi:UPF0755 protein
VAALLLTCVLGISGLFAWSFLPGTVVGEDGEIVEVVIDGGDKGDIVDQLARRGLLASPWLTGAYARLLTPGADFAPRTHLLVRGRSARALVERLSEAKSRPLEKITVVEGWSMYQIAARLRQQGITSELGFIRAASDPELLRGTGIAAPSAEGFLFPATYQFPVDARPETVVKRLALEFKERFTRLLAEHPAHPDLVRLGLGDEEIVALASIVEKETGVVSEAPRVARVFLNRLLDPEAETKGRLQSDPTALYGCLRDASLSSCAAPQGKVTPEMLDDGGNDYNTYRHPGLPPGPISNPGERTLRAVLRPADGRWLYFVADGRGGHTFSETYAEHKAAIAALKKIRP